MTESKSMIQDSHQLGGGRLKMKLLTYFLVIAMLVGVLGLYTYIIQNENDAAIEKIDKRFELLAMHSIPEADNALHMSKELYISFLALHELLLGEAGAKEKLEASVVKFDEYKDTLEAALKKAEEETLKKDLADLAAIEEKHKHFHDDAKKIIALVDAKDITGATALVNNEIDSELNELQNILEKFEEDFEIEIKEADTKIDTLIHIADANIHKTKTLSIIITIIVIILSIVLGLFISNKITKPLEKLSQVVDSVSKGNLNVQVEKTSSIKEINMLADSLDRVMTTMKRSIKRMEDKNGKK